MLIRACRGRVRWQKPNMEICKKYVLSNSEECSMTSSASKQKVSVFFLQPQGRILKGIFEANFQIYQILPKFYRKFYWKFYWTIYWTIYCIKYVVIFPLKKLALCGWFCTMFRLTISLSFLVDKITRKNHWILTVFLYPHNYLIF